MRLQVGKFYINRIGETVKIVGTETLLVVVFYDQKGRCYYEDGWPVTNDEDLRIVARK